MPDYLGSDMRRARKGNDDKKDDADFKMLDEDDILLLRRYAQGPYVEQLKQLEVDNEALIKQINKLAGVETETGLSHPGMWNTKADLVTLQREQPLQVGRCTKILKADSAAKEAKDAKKEVKDVKDLKDKKEITSRYIVKFEPAGTFVTQLHDTVDASEIKEGMRVGCVSGEYKIVLPLPQKIDTTIATMQVEEKPDVTYADVGGCKEQIEKLREIVEKPLLQPEAFIKLGIDPPKGVLLYGPPGTGKTLCAKAVANRTEACFIRVIGSELIQKHIGEGARMVRDIFELARTKKACIIFFDEIDAIGIARQSGPGEEGNSEVQRTMLELITQLDGFDSRGNIKVLMATNRPDTLDPALMRPGRLDRKIEFKLPDVNGRSTVLKIHAKQMSVEKKIRFDLIARLCPNSTGAELRSVCTEAGVFAIRARRKCTNEKNFLEAINKVIKQNAKFSSTAKYLTHN